MAHCTQKFCWKHGNLTSVLSMLSWLTAFLVTSLELVSVQYPFFCYLLFFSIIHWTKIYAFCTTAYIFNSSFTYVPWQVYGWRKFCLILKGAHLATIICVQHVHKRKLCTWKGYIHIMEFKQIMWQNTLFRLSCQLPVKVNDKTKYWLSDKNCIIS